MPCDAVLTAEQTAEQRRREVDRALEALERSLNTGAVEVKVGAQGGICFSGWGKERKGVSDVCAYRKLLAKGSWDLRQSIARAETLSGRKVSERAIAAGIHSHDNGGSWAAE